MTRSGSIPLVGIKNNLKESGNLSDKNKSSKHLSPSQKFYLSNKKFKELFNTKDPFFQYLPDWLINKSNYLEYKYKHPKHLNKTYVRGSIVYVDFGINSGSELSGSHFAVALNKFDSPKSNTLTVVPLSSHNHGKYSIEIEHTITDASFDYFYSESKRAVRLVGNLQYLINFVKGYLYPKETAVYYPKKQFEEHMWQLSGDLLHFNITLSISENPHELFLGFIKNIQNRLNKLITSFKRFNRYNKRTYALTTSITTISKDRIRRAPFEPVVKTTNTTLDNIEKNIRRDFFK